MVNSVGKVDLTQSDNLSGIRKLISDMFGKDYKSVSVFSAKDHDDVRMQSERLADNRLITVANEAIALNDEYYGCFMPSVFGPSHDGLYGGYLRQRAANSKMHAATNKPIEEGNLPPAGSCPLREYRDWGFRRMGSKTPIEGLTPNDLKTFAQKAFSSSQKTAIFAVIPEDISANISVYETNIDSEQYNSLPDERGNFQGLTIKGYEIPKAYNNFVKMLIGDKENLSRQEAQKLLETVKALETIVAFNKPQQKGSANAQKEDVDIFDISGDGLLNRGDITAIELFIKTQTDKEFAEKLAGLTPENWNSLKSLRTVSGLTDKKARELFDLDGNGNVETKDYELYRQMLGNPNKFDIDGDNFVDDKDIALTKEYFKALLQRAKEDKSFRRNTEEIVGSQAQMENLQSKIYKK